MGLNFIVYSPQLEIPLFRVVLDQGDTDVKLVFRNSRTGVTDTVPISDYINYVLDGCLVGDRVMFYSPHKSIPIGAYVHDRFGRVFIEIKNRKQIERISISKYVSILRENEALADN